MTRTRISFNEWRTHGYTVGSALLDELRGGRLDHKITRALIEQRCHTAADVLHKTIIESDCGYEEMLNGAIDAVLEGAR